MVDPWWSVYENGEESFQYLETSWTIGSHILHGTEPLGGLFACENLDIAEDFKVYEVNFFNSSNAVTKMELLTTNGEDFIKIDFGTNEGDHTTSFTIGEGESLYGFTSQDNV